MDPPWPTPPWTWSRLRFSERLDTLRPLLKHRVETGRMHEHPGNVGRAEVAQAICERIPGLDISSTWSSPGRVHVQQADAAAAFKQDVHRNQLQAVVDAGVTMLAGIYHACHRELCSHERDRPFEVVNSLQLVGEEHWACSGRTCSSA